MEGMQTLEEMEHESQIAGQSGGLSSKMQLLLVPGSTSPVPMGSCSNISGVGAGGGTSREKFLRRYSCNPQGKGAHNTNESGSAMGASPTHRRSSLAAIKWSVLARRISMGLAHEREAPEDPSKAIAEVNTNVALLRDVLIHIGQSKDGPEMREKVRRVRRQSIEACKHAVQIILNQIHNDIADEIPMDFSPQLVLLFFCTQLLLKELRKCKRLVVSLPIDMTSYYAENRPGPSNFAGVLSQIILCRQINPDFNQEELCSIDKDTNEIEAMLDSLQEFMPKENSQVATGFSYEEVVGRRSRRRRRRSLCDFQSLCCLSKSRRLSNH